MVRAALVQFSGHESKEINVGKADGCKIHTLVTKDPMTEVKPTDADKKWLREILV